MRKVKSFKDLGVWQLAHKLSIEVAELVKKFPKDEKYDLTDQMRRSARSVPSDIAEGWARYHFNDKLTFYERANSSLNELSNHFEEALANKYITKDEYNYFSKKINEIGFLIRKMMRNIVKVRDNYHAKKTL